MTDDAVPTEGLDLSLSTDETSVEAPPGSPWDDLHAYVATPRLTGLTLSHDGQTLVASVQQLNHEKNGYVSSLWRVDPTGDNPSRRVTRGAEGEAAAAGAAVSPVGPGASCASAGKAESAAASAARLIADFTDRSPAPGSSPGHIRAKRPSPSCR